MAPDDRLMAVKIGEDPPSTSARPKRCLKGTFTCRRVRSRATRPPPTARDFLLSPRAPPAAGYRRSRLSLTGLWRFPADSTPLGSSGLNGRRSDSRGVEGIPAPQR